MINCNNNGGIKAIYILKSSDLLSSNPLKIKRKYGKFKRKIFKIELCKKNTNT